MAGSTTSVCPSSAPISKPSARSSWRRPWPSRVRSWSGAGARHRAVAVPAGSRRLPDRAQASRSVSATSARESSAGLTAPPCIAACSRHPSAALTMTAATAPASRPGAKQARARPLPPGCPGEEPEPPRRQASLRAVLLSRQRGAIPRAEAPRSRGTTAAYAPKRTSTARSSPTAGDPASLATRARASTMGAIRSSNTSSAAPGDRRRGHLRRTLSARRPAGLAHGHHRTDVCPPPAATRRVERDDGPENPGRVRSRSEKPG